jgi:YggT family protein
MGATAAIFAMPIFDAVSAAENFVSVFIGVYVLLIIAYILTSWIRMPYSPTLNRVQRFLYDVCEPYLRLFRRLIPSVGPLDLSPIIGILVLYVLERLIVTLIDRLH